MKKYLVEKFDDLDVWFHVNVARHFHNMWDWIRWRTFNRYNIIKIGKPDYYDFDEQIEQSLITIFKAFGDLEYLEFREQESITPTQKKAFKELIKTYKFFTEEYPKLQKELEEVENDLDSTFYECEKIRKEIRDKSTEHFKTIIEYREYIWI